MNNHSCKYRDVLHRIINNATCPTYRDGYARISFDILNEAHELFKQEVFFVISDEKGTFVVPSHPNGRGNYLLSNGDLREESDDEFRDRRVNGNKKEIIPFCNLCSNNHLSHCACTNSCQTCIINGNNDFCEILPCLCFCHKG